MQKLTPEIVVICKIPPVFDNKEANKNVDLYNENVNCTYGSKSGYQVLKLNTMIKSINNWSFLYWDKIHLNDEHSVTFLRNCLRFFICQYSNDLPRPEKVQKFNNQKQKILYVGSILINSHAVLSVTLLCFQAPHIILCRVFIAKACFFKNLINVWYFCFWSFHHCQC